MRVGQIVRLPDRDFRIAIVLHVYAAQGQVLASKWLNNSQTWTKPRLLMIGKGAMTILRDMLEARSRRVVDRAIESVAARGNVVRYKHGEHLLGGAEVGP
jgi:hypothetical protein